MAELSCPACRRRFDPAQPDAPCRRCGADLALLVRLHRSSQRQAVAGLQLLGTAPRRAAEHFHRAQTLFQHPEPARLLQMLHSREKAERLLDVPGVKSFEVEIGLG